MKKLKIQNGGTVKNSPVPASQLPHRKDKNYNVPDVIGNKVKESKKTPYTKSLTSTKVAKGKSGIHIKPENKGKFTATKKATGKSTEELTHSKNPITKKRAIFAQNAKKWKHKAGGKIAGDATKKEDGGKLSKDYIAKAREKAGGSNVGKKTFASGEKRTGPYVGPSGGAPKGSYPVPDLAHAKSAIKLSGHAPNPAGIKEAVYRKFPQLKKKEGGSIGLNEKEGDQAAVYKKGNKVVKGQKGVSGIEDSWDKNGKYIKKSVTTKSDAKMPTKFDEIKERALRVNKWEGKSQTQEQKDSLNVYNKLNPKYKQMGGQIYGAAKNGKKIDPGKWKKSKSK